MSNASEMRFSAPLLDALAEARVFALFRAEEDGKYYAREECDQYFGCDLSASDLRLLAAELVAVADGLLTATVRER
jgi:hypothetical protein